MTCPHCASATTKEQTQKTMLGYCMFCCSACKRLFNERTGMPVFRVQRERTIQGQRRCEIAYGLITLSVRQCSPQQLLAFIRAHWKVENHLHWRRDALLGEDRCQVRAIPVMEMRAVLNTVVLALMDLHRVSSVARQLRRFAFHPEEALPWLLSVF